MKRNEKLELRRKQIKPENRELVRKSFEISDAIFDILEKKGISQREFAQLLGKNESEISKWLTGTHNFTLSTITKIESVLGEQFVYINNPIQNRSLYNKIIKEYFRILYSYHSFNYNQINQCYISISSKPKYIDLKQEPEKMKVIGFSEMIMEPASS